MAKPKFSSPTTSFHRSQLSTSQDELGAPPRKTKQGIDRDPSFSDREHHQAFHWRDLNRILFVAAAAGALLFKGTEAIPFYTVIGVICTLVGGYPILREAIKNIVERRMTMELSMTIAIFAALAIREIFTALVLTLLVLVAEVPRHRRYPRPQR